MMKIDTRYTVTHQGPEQNLASLYRDAGMQLIRLHHASSPFQAEFHPGALPLRRVGSRARRVLDAYETQGLRPPVVYRQDEAKFNQLGSEAVERMTAILKEDVQRSGLSYRFQDFDKARILKPNKEIYEVTLQGKKRALRKLNESKPFSVEAFRKTYAAYLLNKALGLSTLPPAELVLVDGALAVFSDWIDGRSGEVVSLHQLNPRSLEENYVFEFLVGNADGHRANLRSPDGKHFIVFDHDFAFAIGLVEHENDWYPFGSLLPEEIDAELRSRLESMNIPDIEKRALTFLLTEREIASLIFRQNMLLQKDDY